MEIKFESNSKYAGLYLSTDHKIEINLQSFDYRKILEDKTEELTQTLAYRTFCQNMMNDNKTMVHELLHALNNSSHTDSHQNRDFTGEELNRLPFWLENSDKYSIEVPVPNGHKETYDFNKTSNIFAENVNRGLFNKTYIEKSELPNPEGRHLWALYYDKLSL